MENVTVQRNAFIFCRYSVAALIWVALLIKSFWLLTAVFVILALSALLTVRRAPMIWLWTNTLGRVIPSADEVLDIKGMRFAHTLGAVLALMCLATIYHGNPMAWWLVGAFALLKTTSALGWCPGYKLYACATGGRCCALTAKR